MEKKKYIASFVKRGERPLTAGRQKIVDETLPKIEISDNFNFDEFSKQNNDKVWLEIGFGAGEHLAQQAAKNSDVGIIGCEIFQKGISRLVTYVHEDNLNNVRIWKDDARLLLDSLPDNTLDRVFILFPDPWPKTKHHKRRLLSQETLNILKRVMKKNGKLRFATDHMPYLRWTICLLQKEKDFLWNAKSSNDWNTSPKDHYKTRYEEKLKTGDAPVYLDYILKN